MTPTLSSRGVRLEPLRVNGRFATPPTPEAADPKQAGLREFLRWRAQRRRAPRPGPFHVPRAPARERLPEAPERGIAATWAGHSSVVLQLDGLTYLVDPVWSARVGGVVKRLTPPGIAWTALPRVDALLVSHDHYDHLDAATVARLPRDTPVFCPLGLAAWFARRGFRDVSELTWWEGRSLRDHRVTLVPAQHFSGRRGYDRDRTLWGGFVVRGQHGASAYYAGDSGYFGGFRQIGEAFPGLDLALVPIGAYEPRWFMAPVHVDPAQAGQAFLDVGARAMLPVHWGAFRLADEALDEPPKVLRAWWESQGLARERLLLPRLGETLAPPS